MKVYITKKDEFKGKKNGVEYVKLSFLRASGETGEVFTTKDKFESFNVDEDKFITPEELNDALSDRPTLDVEYDQKGFVVGIE